MVFKTGEYKKRAKLGLQASLVFLCVGGWLLQFPAESRTEE